MGSRFEVLKAVDAQKGGATG